tara:strand:- start:2075 stop:2203 length:129 start_codon:yes stop_codon:yes gene_type:complete
MSEHQEAIVRGQVILMMARNLTKPYIIKKLFKRFLNSIRGKE